MEGADAQRWRTSEEKRETEAEEEEKVKGTEMKEKKAKIIIKCRRRNGERSRRVDDANQIEMGDDEI